MGTSGAFYNGTSQNTTGVDSGWGGAYNRGVGYFNASRVSSAYSRTDNAVIPKSVIVIYCIKY